MEEPKYINNESKQNKEGTITKLNRISDSFFKKVDEKSGIFYFIIASICFVVFVSAMIYSINKLKFNEESETYTMKNKGKKIELKLEKESPYFNDFLTDTEEVLIKKENDLSSLVYRDKQHYEETDNVKIRVNLPKINISSELNNKEIKEIQEKIIDINDKISTVRTIFEGNNELNLNYYASYYQNVLSFGYSYYENVNNSVTSENNSFVYDANRNKMISFSEYINSRNISEKKLSDAIKEIIRLEKLKYKYNKKNKSFYIETDGSINLILDNKSKLKITIKE